MWSVEGWQAVSAAPGRLPSQALPKATATVSKMRPFKTRGHRVPRDDLSPNSISMTFLKWQNQRKGAEVGVRGRGGDDQRTRAARGPGGGECS